MPSNTLKLWTSVDATDPACTKKVNLRGNFTAIDSYYQIKRATETFGPLGQGWGYTAEFRFENNLAIAIVDLWYRWDGEKSEPFTICATNQFVTPGKNGAAGHVDEDAAKKALTDAITKGLSYLGFSADVFMGKFDDNKYVDDLNKELRGKEAVGQFEAQITPLIQSITDAASYAKQREALIPLIGSLKAVSPAKAAHYQNLMVELKAKHVGAA